MAYLNVVEGGTLFPKDRCVVSFDGTHIAYTFLGTARKNQPTIVLCAGYVCPDNFWKYLAPALARKYRVLVWNYRGSGASGAPREPGYRARNYTADDFTMDRYARDLKEILDHEGIDDIVVIGHSMGVQVCLEAYRLMPERVRSIVSVTGPYASPLRTFYNSTLMPRIFPVASVAINLFPRPLLVLWKALMRSGLPHPGAQKLGALGPKAKAEDMRPYYDHMAELDPLIMMKMAEALHRHSAEDILRQIKAPTLVIVGDKDNFTPPWLGRVMASRIPVAELVVVPGGTHGTIIEEPRLVNKAILDFLQRHLAADAKAPLTLVGKPAPRRPRGRRTAGDGDQTLGFTPS
jgi:pimeloyl-ACP methyl ester carboxylesterase